MADLTAGARSAYGALDDAKLSRFHRLTVLTAGMGFFTDAYDLFIIGTVTTILTPLWHLSTAQISLLNSISLLSSVFGAVLFGRLMDVFGRKAMYGVEIALLAGGALLSAFAWDFGALLAFRVLVGVGVGGDYATSAVITSEYANRANRGRLVGTVFAMQGFGLLAGPLVAAALLGAGIPHALAWRIMLGLGAIPAASVVYLRRRIRETPRFTLGVRGDVDATARTVEWAMTIADASGEHSAVAPRSATRPGGPAARALPAAPGPGAAAASTPAGPATGPRRGARRGGGTGLGQLVRRPYLRRLVGTAGSWFLMDIAFYGNSISSPLILKALQPHATLLDNVLIAAGIFAVFAVPGYWVAVHYLDTLGRRRIQWQGFLVMTGAFAAIALAPGVVKVPAVFLLLFGISYFFIEFGPNETTFVYPSEIFPVHVRGTGDGLSAAAGKLGAFIGALFVPTLLKTIHLSGVMTIMAGVSLLGVLLTIATLPEPRQLSLEEAAGEADSLETELGRLTGEPARL